MNVFTLTIKLGNEAMQNGEDIADALRKVAYKIEQSDDSHGTIFDENGNRVGEWQANVSI